MQNIRIFPVNGGNQNGGNQNDDSWQKKKKTGSSYLHTSKWFQEPRNERAWWTTSRTYGMNNEDILEGRTERKIWGSMIVSSELRTRHYYGF